VTDNAGACIRDVGWVVVYGVINNMYSAQRSNNSICVFFETIVVEEVKSFRCAVQTFTPLRAHMLHLTNGSVVAQNAWCCMWIVCEEAVVCEVISIL
jgi:hypothetical protein